VPEHKRKRSNVNTAEKMKNGKTNAIPGQYFGMSKKNSMV
jgi:hypothetical protein